MLYIFVLVFLTLSTFLSPLIFSDTCQRSRLSPLKQFGGMRVSLNKRSEDEAFSEYISETSPYVNTRLIWQSGRYLHRRHELRLPLQCVHSTQAADTLFYGEFNGGEITRKCIHSLSLLGDLKAADKGKTQDGSPGVKAELLVDESTLP